MRREGNKRHAEKTEMETVIVRSLGNISSTRVGIMVVYYKVHL